MSAYEVLTMGRVGVALYPQQAGVHLDPLPLLRLRNLVDEGGGGRPVNAVHVNDVVQREVEDQVRADDQDVLLQVVNNQNKEEGGVVQSVHPILSNPIQSNPPSSSP